MLTQNRVLEYIKDNLGFDFMVLELSDEKIIDYFKTYTLREFSRYFPDVNKVYMNPLLPTSQVPGRGNEYYFSDPEGLEILNVKNVYYDMSDLLINGHPPLGPFTQGELRNWALDVETAGMLKMFSNYDRTIEFTHPNIVRISPTPNNVRNITIEYERNHPDDLRKVSNEFQLLFCQLAFEDIMILIGIIRQRYGGGNLRTPFGEIPLGAEILEEGKEMKRDLIDKMTLGSLPNVTFDRG
jgi:hypothetical protein